MNTKGNLAEGWQFFFEQWQDYEIATALNTADSNVRIASFLLVLGSDAFYIYRYLPLTEAEKKDLSKIQGALEAHFISVLNVTYFTYERYVFGMCKQEPHENIEEHVTKLRKLRETCSFGDLRNDFIKDRLVLGVSDNGARAALLREAELTLNQAIDICRSREVTRQQLDALCKDEGETTINLLSRRFKQERQDTPKLTKDCRTKDYCRTMRKGRNSCPAFGAVCRRCGKRNHFEKVCRQAIRVRNVEKCASDESVYQTHKEHVIGKVHAEGKQWFTALKVKTNPVKDVMLRCLIDTCSTCNTISYDEYCSLYENSPPRLKQSEVRLRTYDGTVIKPVGQARIECELKNVAEVLKFEVVKENLATLLGSHACEKLGVITVDKELTVNKVEQPNVQQ